MNRGIFEVDRGLLENLLRLPAGSILSAWWSHHTQHLNVVIEHESIPPAPAFAELSVIGRAQLVDRAAAADPPIVGTQVVSDADS